TAVGEASALKAVTASQRAQLDEMLRATLAAARGHFRKRRILPGKTYCSMADFGTQPIVRCSVSCGVGG
ncbi:hypothetical protein ACUXQ2_005585, partial [Cupriavidus metallidurans]